MISIDNYLDINKSSYLIKLISYKAKRKNEKCYCC